MRDYEILYIVRPDLDENEVGEAAKKVDNLIESVGGSVQRTNIWGKRRLAYEVSHLREGHYVLTDFQIEASRVPEMEATLRISDQVFRHLIVRKPDVKTPVAAAPAVAAVPEEAAADEKGETATEAPVAEAVVPATATEEPAASGAVAPAAEGEKVDGEPK